MFNAMHRSGGAVYLNETHEQNTSMRTLMISLEIIYLLKI